MSECITLLCAVVSAIAAWISIHYARKANKIQKNLAINKDDIGRINRAINNIRVAKALFSQINGDIFNDEEFTDISNNNLRKAKISIVVLLQNPILQEMLKGISGKSFQHEQLDSIVVSLEECKRLLLTS